MCGRYTIVIPIEELIKNFQLEDDQPFEARYNIAPTQNVPAVCQLGDGTRVLRSFRWGLVPHWAKDLAIGNKMINARSETVAEKPAFRGPIRYRRCLLPASGFFEWSRQGKTKVPFYIRRKDKAPLAFAGIWDSWKGPDGVVESCSILTTGANDLVGKLHDRMPVILSPAEFPIWLDREINEPEPLQSLFTPFPSDLLVADQVSPLVNNPRNDSPEILIPEG